MTFSARNTLGSAVVDQSRRTAMGSGEGRSRPREGKKKKKTTTTTSPRASGSPISLATAPGWFPRDGSEILCHVASCGNYGAHENPFAWGSLGFRNFSYHTSLTSGRWSIGWRLFHDWNSGRSDPPLNIHPTFLLPTKSSQRAQVPP